MRVLTSTCVALLAACVFAQDQFTYSDPKTGIDFQGFLDKTSGFRSGYVLPLQSTVSDFIVQIITPLKSGAGYGAVVLNSGMINHLIVAVWPDGNNVMASFRKATDRVSPAVWNGPASMKVIKNGTYVNSTHLSYTFVCAKCFAAGTGLVFQPTEENAGVGWGWAPSTPSPSSSTSATMKIHTRWGLAGLTTKIAKSDKYNTYAAMAS